ncbi:P-loop containing nucleoside triphosphate hydrolase protein [Dimargaris cristalligena]|uniref:P-loop containing nucleoside triphosphate hydrolase protein n=1 Tax=Dimargaris cristalligena TaxID=215637 RepID=A0A4P9ZKJ0_9FUNG|nr:P-loop containing nucleoside triphosphate hydrolase protein [Dimargaris cristalligena]|eukprot:RKP33774.1 P-loop containing nucleoside triphosphate hydrolase protein [Dimargaris cristalligena]
MLFVTHFRVTYRPLSQLSTLIYQIVQVYEHGHDLIWLIDNHSDICDPDEAATDWDISDGTIEFKDVYFGYNPKRPVLKGIGFKVQGGTTTAIVGETGGGKTTITKLIARFYDVSQGNVTIDGVDVRHVKQKDLRKSISIVPQNANMLYSTIRYNIQYGLASTSMSATLEDVHEAARKAQIHQKIVSLPNGYDSVIGGSSIRLSGGELQRINVARGLVRPHKVLLLDEATSALDMITERKVQGALKDDNQGKTCVVIAHRLSTIIHADQILVIQNGGIAERGTFAELIAVPDGVFKGMWDSQMNTSKESNTSIILESSV